MSWMCHLSPLSPGVIPIRRIFSLELVLLLLNVPSADPARQHRHSLKRLYVLCALQSSPLHLMKK